MPKILVVDDSISVRKALERILVTKSMDVSLAKSGEEALEIFTQVSPDLVIADVVMPGRSGFDLCQELRSHPDRAMIPVLLISGIVNQEEIERAEAVGAFGVIKKPFAPNELLPKIERALEEAALAIGEVPAVDASVELMLGNAPSAEVVTEPPSLVTPAQPEQSSDQPVAAPTMPRSALPQAAADVLQEAGSAATSLDDPIFASGSAETALESGDIFEAEPAPELQANAQTPEPHDSDPERTKDAHVAPTRVAQPVVTSEREPEQASAGGIAAAQAELTAALQPLLYNAHIDAVLLADSQGRVISHQGSASAHSANMASFARTLSSIAGVLGTQLDKSELQVIMIEYAEGGVLVSNVGTDLRLMLLLSDLSALSMVRYLLRKQTPVIRQALG